MQTPLHNSDEYVEEAQPERSTVSVQVPVTVAATVNSMIPKSHDLMILRRFFCTMKERKRASQVDGDCAKQQLSHQYMPHSFDHGRVKRMFAFCIIMQGP
jgi:hypothetical protein